MHESTEVRGLNYVVSITATERADGLFEASIAVHDGTSHHDPVVETAKSHPIAFDNKEAAFTWGRDKAQDWLDSNDTKMA